MAKGKNDDAWKALFNKYKIEYNEDAENDTVIPKRFKVVPLDVVHQELNGKNGYQKCHCHAGQKKHDLSA